VLRPLQSLRCKFSASRLARITREISSRSAALRILGPKAGQLKRWIDGALGQAEVLQPNRETRPSARGVPRNHRPHSSDVAREVHAAGGLPASQSGSAPVTAHPPTRSRRAPPGRPRWGRRRCHRLAGHPPAHHISGTFVSVRSDRHPQLDPIVRRMHEVLPRPEVSLGGLHRGVSQKQLNLFQLAARRAAELRA
jgi:hypothetical protein